MKPKKDGSYAVVTGASQGLGAAFAEACARKGWNLCWRLCRRRSRDSRGGAAKAPRSLRSLRPNSIFPYPRTSMPRAIRSRGGKEHRSPGKQRRNSPERAVRPNPPRQSSARTVEVNIQSTMAITYGLIPGCENAALPAFLPWQVFRPSIPCRSSPSMPQANPFCSTGASRFATNSGRLG